MKTKAPQVILQDFESEAIMPRPNYPPKPVSCALKWPDRSDWLLMAWGHGDGSKAAGNNCTEREARAEYKKARESRWPMCFQNGMFDQDIAETHWEIPLLPWERYHDTMFLAFYHDPHSPSLALKPLAERYLGIKPEEQDRMNEWIFAHIPEAKKKPSTVGAYIARCPYQIVKPYHKGDLIRTGGLFSYLWPLIHDAEMDEAYRRDRQLVPIFLDNARTGMRINTDALGDDLPKWRSGIEAAEAWLRKRLKKPSLNFDSPAQLGPALIDSGAVSGLRLTKKGALSTGKKSMTVDKFKDRHVYHALKYRSQLETCITTFGDTWMELAALSRDGMTIHPSWSLVRSPKGDKDDTKGARSGRIICARPNFLNIPKKFKKAFVLGYEHPTFLGARAVQLPYMRSYCLPDKGEEWGKRDFNQQELRLFGHFEDGPVAAEFNADPITRVCLKCGAPVGRKCVGGITHQERQYDIHEVVRAEEEAELIAAGLRDEFDRDSAKGTVFGRLYGQGIPGLMDLLGLDESERDVAVAVQRALNRAIPSIKELDNELKALSRQGSPIRTWGGRLYYVEEPRYVEKFGRDMDFAYKLLNYLMQGSGGDVTKETIIRWHAHPKKDARFVVSVYDEVDFSSAKQAMKQNQSVLKECMLSIETDVPMLSDGERGKNWGTLEKFKD